MPNKRFNKQVPGFGFKNGGRAMKRGGGKDDFWSSKEQEKMRSLVFIHLIWE